MKYCNEHPRQEPFEFGCDICADLKSEGHPDEWDDELVTRTSVVRCRMCTNRWRLSIRDRLFIEEDVTDLEVQCGVCDHEFTVECEIQHTVILRSPKGLPRYD